MQCARRWRQGDARNLLAVTVSPCGLNFADAAIELLDPMRRNLSLWVFIAGLPVRPIKHLPNVEFGISAIATAPADAAGEAVACLPECERAIMWPASWTWGPQRIADQIAAEGSVEPSQVHFVCSVITRKP